MNILNTNKQISKTNSSSLSNSIFDVASMTNNNSNTTNVCLQLKRNNSI